MLTTATADTALRQRTWQALRRICVGQTTNYGRLAIELGLCLRAAIVIGEPFLG